MIDTVNKFVCGALISQAYEAVQSHVHASGVGKQRPNPPRNIVVDWYTPQRQRAISISQRFLDPAPKVNTWHRVTVIGKSARGQDTKWQADLLSKVSLQEGPKPTLTQAVSQSDHISNKWYPLLAFSVA